MRRIMCLAVAAGIALGNVGCIAVVSHKGPIGHRSQPRQAVAMNGEIYVVDVDTNDVYRIAPGVIAEAEIFTETEITTTETTGG